MIALPIRTALFVSFLLVALTGWVQALGEVTLVNVRGQVTVISAEGAVIENVRSGMQVSEGTRIITGSEGGLILVFSTGTSLSVSPDTEITLDAYRHEPAADSGVDGQEAGGDSTTQLSVGYGEILGRVKKLRPESRFEVRTPIGIAGVRGTDILINVTREGDQWVVTFGVEDGTLRIFNVADVDIGADLGELEAGESLKLRGEIDDSGKVIILEVEKQSMTGEQLQALSDAINEQASSDEVQDGPEQQLDIGNPNGEGDESVPQVNIPADYQIDPYAKAGQRR